MGWIKRKLASRAGKKALKYLKGQKDDLLLFWEYALLSRWFLGSAYDVLGSQDLKRILNAIWALVVLGILFIVQHGTPTQVDVDVFLEEYHA